MGKLGDYPCYNASKDMVVPLMSSPGKYAQSPLLGAPTHERRFLGVFKGRIQVRGQLWAVRCPVPVTIMLSASMLLPAGCRHPWRLLSCLLRAAHQPTLQPRHKAVPGQLLP